MSNETKTMGQTIDEQRVEALLPLARRVTLTRAELIVLPAVVQGGAKKIGMTNRQFIAKCIELPELLRYIETVCREVAA